MNTLPRHLLVMFAVTGSILLVPLAAMQWTHEVMWTGADFAVAAGLLAGTGLLYAMALRKLRTRRARIAAGVVLAGGLLLVWAELAVGIVGA